VRGAQTRLQSGSNTRTLQRIGSVRGTTPPFGSIKIQPQLCSVTAEVASSSLVVPASFFNKLQDSPQEIWVQSGSNQGPIDPLDRGSNPFLTQNSARQNGLYQLVLGATFACCRRLKIFVCDAEIRVPQVVANRELVLAPPSPFHSRRNRKQATVALD
jgi:hypothetical protein